ncbi:MAG: hypothetical protein RLZZ385_1993 [Pseudomonadota bacterium]|jgi:hypothetical protein
MQWLKVFLFPVPALIAGAMSFYVWQLSLDNQHLREQVTAANGLRSELQEQQALNARQREDFEGQVQQLQNSLLGAQAQMSNLSQALQEAREMIEPGASPPAAGSVSTPVAQPLSAPPTPGGQ